MRRTVLALSAALTIAACSGDSTSPDTYDLTTLDAGAFGTALTTVGGYDADVYQNRLVNALPEDLRLTDAQKAQIRAIVEAFHQSTRADREALAAIFREARQAIEAKKPRSEVQAILAQGAEIGRRLMTAELKLKQDIDAVLTPAQKAWLAEHRPRSCRPDRFPPLTEEQKAKIRTLEENFRQAGKFDEASRRALLQAILAVLTAEQKASGCLPLG